jgi:hypothetical protein
MTAENHVAVLIHKYGFSARFRRRWWAVTVVFVVIVSLRLWNTLLAISTSNGGVPLSGWGITTLVAWVFLLIVFSPWVRHWNIRRSALLFVQKHSAEMLGPMTLSIGPTGITVTRANREEFRRWETVQRIETVSQLATIICGDLVAYSVPMSAFLTQRDFENFVSLARSYIAGSEHNAQPPDLPESPKAI